MKAMVIEEFGGLDKIHMKEMPNPVPQENEVLIKVAYAGVNPVDWKICEGHLKNRLPHDFPLILGFDVSGIVIEVGKNVKELKVGNEVFFYARRSEVKWGSYAEFLTFDAKDVVKKPKNLSFAEAAALPLISLTAWQCLFDAAQLQKGEAVFIQAGSGGVGSMAIQFAKNIGATVITTASKKKHDYVKKLGADVALDYSENYIDQVKAHAKDGVDVVIDCYGGESFKKSFSCLRKGGRIVSILEHFNPSEAEKLGIIASYVFASPSGKDLKSIAKLIEEKKVVPPSIEEMPLKNAALALEKLKNGNVFGKLVLKVS